MVLLGWEEAEIWAEVVGCDVRDEAGGFGTADQSLDLGGVQGCFFFGFGEFGGFGGAGFVGLGLGFGLCFCCCCGCFFGFFCECGFVDGADFDSCEFDEGAHQLGLGCSAGVEGEAA